jgi:hypothetical protein
MCEASRFVPIVEFMTSSRMDIAKPPWRASGGRGVANAVSGDLAEKISLYQVLG